VAAPVHGNHGEVLRQAQHYLLPDAAVDEPAVHQQQRDAGTLALEGQRSAVGRGDKFSHCS